MLFRSVDKRVYSDELLEELIKQWKVDALGFAAAKMTRRIVGLAKTSDIETLEPAQREGAARGVLRSAQLIVRERHTNTDIANISEKIEELMRSVKTGGN